MRLLIVSFGDFTIASQLAGEFGKSFHTALPLTKEYLNGDDGKLSPDIRSFYPDVAILIGLPGKEMAALEYYRDQLNDLMEEVGARVALYPPATANSELMSLAKSLGVQVLRSRDYQWNIVSEVEVMVLPI